MYDISKCYQAKDAADAVRALMEDETAIVISGGTDVLIQVREGKLAGASLISVHGLPELTGIRMDEDGTLVIGAAETFSHITNHPLIQTYAPVLGEAVDTVGGPQIRNMGTIGGNVCNGVTSADSASTLMTFDAVLELFGPEGVRLVPVRDFYLSAKKTVRRQNEILLSVQIPKSEYEGYTGKYIKYGKRNAMEIATLGCAVRVKLAPDHTVLEDLRIGFGVAGPVPMRCTETEAAAKGRKLDESLINEIGKGVLAEVHPRSSWRATKEFRLQLVEELVKRAFREAVEKGGGSFNA